MTRSFFVGMILLVSMDTASAALTCNGRPYGAVDRPFTGVSTYEAMFDVVVPDGVVIPAHGISTGTWDWGCTTNITVDLDTAMVYRKFSCNPASSSYQASWDHESPGAEITHTTDKNGRLLDIAIKRHRVTSAQIEQLVCMANEAWVLGPYGDPVQRDNNGIPIKPMPPPPAEPHGVSYLRLMDQGTEKLLGGFSRNPYRGAADNLAQYVGTL